MKPTLLRAPIALFALAALACWDRAEPDLEVSLRAAPEAPAEAGPAPPAESSNTLRFAYTSVLSPERSALTWVRFGEYLSRKLSVRVEILRRRTYAEINELLRDGVAQAGLVCTGAFAAGADDFGLEAIAIPVIGGETTYRSLLITRPGSGIRSLEDLKGRSFAFTDPLSNTGYRYVAERLDQRGFAPEEFFSDVVFTYGHDKSIDAVRAGIVDAGSVDSLVWEELLRRNPELGSEVIVFERSEAFPINPVAAAPSMDPELRDRLVDALLAMDEDPMGQAVLQDLGTDAFVRPSAEELAGYEAIIASWRRLSAAGHPEI